MNLTWRNPPAHHWYAAKSPCLSIQCRSSRAHQRALTSSRSGHLRSMTFAQGIGTSVQEESDPDDDEMDEDGDNNNEVSKDPSNADAFSALETAMEWYEQQSEFCPTQLLLFK
ncbi:uncharacterized protein TNCV_332821 [Trichonephila clavipes]|nr:uncharacterized protein TNCV_332821 [Trichonephila clavipes]